MSKHSFHGWLNIDKPAGLSSAQVVSRVRRILKIKKIGHAGTLDPFASGVLPLAVGEATKTVPYVVQKTKVYQFEVHWGVQTTTDDIEGQVLTTSDVRPTPESIQKILPRFLGRISQVPPVYSALKIEGKRAYARARAGEVVEMVPRFVQIEGLTCLSTEHLDRATFQVTCGPGTYVRSLGRDIALALGTVGYISALRRLQVGRFQERDTILLENLEEIVHNPISVEKGIYTIDAVLDDIPAAKIGSDLIAQWRHGGAVFVKTAFRMESENVDLPVLCMTEDGNPLGLGVFRDGKLHPKKVFNI